MHVAQFALMIFAALPFFGFVLFTALKQRLIVKLLLAFVLLGGVAFNNLSGVIFGAPGSSNVIPANIVPKIIHGQITNASFPLAGIPVTPALFGLTTIVDIICGNVQIGGSVNTATVVAKYDPVGGSIFAFFTGSAVTTNLQVITGNIAQAIQFPVTVIGY